MPTKEYTNRINPFGQKSSHRTWSWRRIVFLIIPIAFAVAWFTGHYSSKPYMHSINQMSISPPDLSAIEQGGLDVVVAFMDESGAISVQEFGDLRKDEVAPQDTLVDLGSITKTVTAIAILKLVEKGKLGLNETLDEIWSDTPDEMASITVHELLTHTSGLGVEVGHDHEQLSREAFVDRVFETELDEDRVGEYHYSNMGYGLLAAIVERRSGKQFEGFLKEDILAPAGLVDLGYERAYSDNRSLLSGRAWRTGFQKQPIRKASWGGRAPGWNLVGNGGLVATPVSYLRFWAAVRGGRVISMDLLKKALTPHIDARGEEGSSYGYGVMVQDLPSFGRIHWHDGENALFSSEWREIDANGLVVFTAGRNQDAFEAMKLIFKELQGRVGT